MNIGKYLRGEDRHVGTSRIEKDTMENKQPMPVTFGVGPAPDGVGAVLTFNNRGMVHTIQMSEIGVNQLINLLRAVVPDE